MHNNGSQLEKIPQIHVYPDGLTEKDIQLINKQCELQSATSKEQIEGFARAYKEAKDLFLNGEILNEDEIENTILHFAALIEKRNEKGYRSTPVTFADKSMALKPELIERAMKNFSLAYAERSIEPIETYTEFEKSTLLRMAMAV